MEKRACKKCNMYMIEEQRVITKPSIVSSIFEVVVLGLAPRGRFLEFGRGSSPLGSRPCPSRITIDCFEEAKLGTEQDQMDFLFHYQCF